MLCFLRPNPDPPYNLILFWPPSPDDPVRPPGVTTEDEMREWQIARELRALPNALIYRVDADALPADHYFFNAWEWVDGAVVEARAKCEAIHMGRIRVTRDRELAALDVPYMRALEVGDVDEQTRIAGLKQALRDIPQTFDLSGYASVADLKAAWPDVLPTPLS